MAFQCTFAGVAFGLDDPGHHIWLNQNLPLDFLTETARWQDRIEDSPSYRTNGVAINNWLNQPIPQIGRYFYPWGAARWSEFHMLASSNQVKAMIAASDATSLGAQSGLFILQSDPSPPIDGLSVGGISTYLFMLPPRPLGVHGGPYEGLYLVSLVDERFWWGWMSAGQIHPDGVSYTWTTLLQTLAANLINFAGGLGISLGFATPSATYGFPAEDSPLYSNFESPGGLLDAAAANVGCVVVRHMDGSYHLDRPADSIFTAQQNRPSPVVRVAGGDLLADDGAPIPVNAVNANDFILPGSVTVSFPEYLTGVDWIDPRDGSDRTRPGYGACYAIQNTLFQAGYPQFVGVRNVTKSIRDTQRAYFVNPGDATPSNQSQLADLALRLAQDWISWQIAFLPNAALQTQMALDEVYHGIRNWSPEGIHDILWSYAGDKAHTRVSKRPWNAGVSEMQHAGLGTPNDGGRPPGECCLEWGILVLITGSILYPGAPRYTYSWHELTPGPGGSAILKTPGRSGDITPVLRTPAYDPNDDSGFSSVPPFGPTQCPVPTGTIAVLRAGFLNPGPPGQEYMFWPRHYGPTGSCSLTIVKSVSFNPSTCVLTTTTGSFSLTWCDGLVQAGSCS